MEIQKNLKRRNSEYALIESAAWAWISRTIRSHSEQAQRERITFVKRIEDEGQSSSRKLCKKLPRNRRVEKDTAIKRKILKNNEDWKNVLWSMIRNHEQWVYWMISDEEYKNDWNILKTQNLLRAWFTQQLWPTYVPHQVLITSSSRKLGRQVGMLRNTWEKKVSLETFLIVNMLNGMLMNYTTIQEIWRHHWRFWEQKELEINGSEEPLQTLPLLCHSVRARTDESWWQISPVVYD